MNGNPNFIGFFDSGVGGISVLIEAISQLPNESFIYYGDSLNAPYGIKTVEEVQALTISAVEKLVERGSKAVVIACNTATSASIKLLRSRFSVPIIGMEPALKLAVDTHVAGQILVLATPMTLKEKKFEQLMKRVAIKHQIIKIPAPELVLAVENHQTSDQELFPLFDAYFKGCKEEVVDSIVLGCTHYIFAKEALMRYFNHTVRLVDGNEGTIRQLCKLLKENRLLSNSHEPGKVEVIMTGGAKSEEMAYQFLNEGGRGLYAR